MDLDQDGKTDIVSGSYTKGIFLFRRTGKGRYGKAQPVLANDGKPLNPGSALAPNLVDWDGDGDQDMFIGTQEGPVFFAKNAGKGKYAPTQVATCVGVPILSMHGGPLVIDLDGDNILDLVLGGDRGVEYYRGLTKGSLDFARPVQLMRTEKGSPGPETRLKLFATDWNTDGKIDLLIGDYRPSGARVLPTPALDAATAEALRRQASSYAIAMLDLADRYVDKAKQDVGLTDLTTATPAQRAAFNAVLQQWIEKDPDYLELSRKKLAVDQQIAGATATLPLMGTVWVMLRQN